ncbi:MAG: heme lyase NrfEFG subunit NrfE, partial [Bacteroidota bacterium]
MIVELGHFALILALVVSGAQALLPACGARARAPRLMAFGASAAYAQLGLLVIAFLSLMHAYVVSDFSVANVWAN